jgi:2OG-Fe(II) oxygenase superfamily
MSDTSIKDRANTISAPPASLENFDGIVARMLPIERLEREKGRLKVAYDAAKPYPHLVIDGLWDPEILNRIIAEFPHQGQRDWLQYDNAHELKQTSRGLFGLSPFTQLFLMEVSSPRFLRVLGEVTGHQDLVADPLFHGGGLHESFRGGWLNLHTDWRQHPTLPLARRLNMIIYLNKDWDPAWGGGIELWNPGASEAGAKADCLFNRTLIFPTTDTSLHGFPAPMTCPENRSRKSISLFYWTMDEGAVKTAQNINFLPGKRQTRLKAAVRAFIPPVLFEVKGALMRLLKK